MGKVSLINGHLDGADTCVICGRDIPEGSQVCVICGKVPSKVQTNYDRIRNMSVEELAEFLANETFRIAKPVFDFIGYGIEKQVIYARRKQWLESEVTE